MEQLLNSISMICLVIFVHRLYWKAKNKIYRLKSKIEQLEYGIEELKLEIGRLKK